MVLQRWAWAAAVVSLAVSHENRWSPMEPFDDARRLRQNFQRLAEESPVWKEPATDYQVDKPTRQPPTRAQDLGKCAWQVLPDVINLAPKETNFFYRSGVWVNKQDAQLCNWVQNRFKIDYTNSDYYVDVKPWFTAQVLRNPWKELQNMDIELPPPRKVTLPVGEEDWHEDWHTIVYKDCDNTPMYVSRELGIHSGAFEVFNHLGQLVATGSRSEMVPESQFYFRDETGKPFAVAGSPGIGEALGSVPPEIAGTWHNDGLAVDVDHWQVWFVSGFESTSYLREPENRWVIVAVVQEHAIFNTLQNDDASNWPSEKAPFVLFLLCSAVAVCAAIGVCCCAFNRIFLMVYPSMKLSTENPFMKMDIGGHPYGSFGSHHHKPTA